MGLKHTFYIRNAEYGMINLTNKFKGYILAQGKQKEREDN
jgi:hypothetical protein